MADPLPPAIHRFHVRGSFAIGTAVSGSEPRAVAWPTSTRAGPRCSHRRTAFPAMMSLPFLKMVAAPSGSAPPTDSTGFAILLLYDIFRAPGAVKRPGCFRARRERRQHLDAHAGRTGSMEGPARLGVSRTKPRGFPGCCGPGISGARCWIAVSGSRRRVWVTTPGAVGYFENEEFVPVRDIPGGRVHSIVRDSAGGLWFAHQERGLIRWEEGKPAQLTAWSVFGDGGFADALAADPKDGGLWIGLFRGGVLYFKMANT